MDACWIIDAYATEMNTIEESKLRVIFAGLAKVAFKHGLTELAAAIERAETIDDLDHFFDEIGELHREKENDVPADEELARLKSRLQSLADSYVLPREILEAPDQHDLQDAIFTTLGLTWNEAFDRNKEIEGYETPQERYDAELFRKAKQRLSDASYDVATFEDLYYVRIVSGARLLFGTNLDADEADTENLEQESRLNRNHVDTLQSELLDDDELAADKQRCPTQACYLTFLRNKLHNEVVTVERAEINMFNGAVEKARFLVNDAEVVEMTVLIDNTQVITHQYLDAILRMSVFYCRVTDGSLSATATLLGEEALQVENFLRRLDAVSVTGVRRESGDNPYKRLYGKSRLQRLQELHETPVASELNDNQAKDFKDAASLFEKACVRILYSEADRRKMMDKLEHYTQKVYEFLVATPTRYVLARALEFAMYCEKLAVLFNQLVRRSDLVKAIYNFDPDRLQPGALDTEANLDEMQKQQRELAAQDDESVKASLKHTVDELLLHHYTKRLNKQTNTAAVAALRQQWETEAREATQSDVLGGFSSLVNNADLLVNRFEQTGDSEAFKHLTEFAVKALYLPTLVGNTKNMSEAQTVALLSLLRNYEKALLAYIVAYGVSGEDPYTSLGFATVKLYQDLVTDYVQNLTKMPLSDYEIFMANVVNPLRQVSSYFTANTRSGTIRNVTADFVRCVKAIQRVKGVRDDDSARKQVLQETEAEADKQTPPPSERNAMLQQLRNRPTLEKVENQTPRRPPPRADADTALGMLARNFSQNPPKHRDDSDSSEDEEW